MNLPPQDRSELSSLPSPQQGAKISFQSLNLGTESVVSLEQLSLASLAYLGDAVYELYVRTHYLLPPKRIRDYHHQVIAKVCAEGQAADLRLLEPYLNDAEREILRRGRNAATRSPRRLSAQIYQQATSLETLIGYLYVYNPQRLNQLLGKLTWK